MPQTDVTKMKVADLKRELKLRGLITTGNKTELQDRLHTALLEGELSLEDTAISGEDLLDEDGVLTDEDEAKILGADENELLHSPTQELGSSVLQKTNSLLSGISNEKNDLNTSTSIPATSGRKIILKRKNSFNASLSSAEAAPLAATKENDQPTAGKVVKLNEHTPITITNEKTNEKEVKISSKISQLTMQQRLEMRAKKFGIGIENPKTTGTSSVTNADVASSSGDTTQIDLLKKRAERFGCVLSSKVAKLDAEEKLLKRKQRFGGNDSTVSNGTKSVDSDAWAEKARMRLERFGASTQAATVQTNSK